MKKEFVIIVLAMLFILATAAYAQIMALPMPCGFTSNIVSMLSNRHNEQMIGQGPSRNGDMVQLYASEQTFTMLITKTDGTSCMAASGAIWKTLARGQPT